MTEQWVHFLHELATTIGAIAAVLAAASSLRNGRTLKNGKREMESKAKRKRTRNGDAVAKDWYKAPDID